MCGELCLFVGKGISTTNMLQSSSYIFLKQEENGNTCVRPLTVKDKDSIQRMSPVLIRAIIVQSVQKLKRCSPPTSDPRSALISELAHRPSLCAAVLPTLNKLPPLSTESTLCMFDLLWFLLRSPISHFFHQHSFANMRNVQWRYMPVLDLQFPSRFFFPLFCDHTSCLLEIETRNTFK